MKELTLEIADRIRVEVNAEFERLELPVRCQSVSLDRAGRIVLDLSSTGERPKHVGSGLGQTPAKAIADAVAKARSWKELGGNHE